MKREPEIRDCVGDDDCDAPAFFCSKFLMLIPNEHTDDDDDDDVPMKKEVKPALLVHQHACSVRLWLGPAAAPRRPAVSLSTGTFLACRKQHDQNDAKYEPTCE
jgi:hypothetical protein